MELQVDKGYQHNDCSAMSKQKRSKIVAPMSLLKAAVTSIADGIIICDPDNVIVLINPAALAMFEISGETSYLGADYNHFLSHYVIHNEDQRPTTLVQDQTSDAGDVHTISIKTPSGRKAYVQVRSVPIFDQRKQKRGMIHIFHDVTELRQKELQYQKSNQSLQALLSLLTAITYLLSRTW